MPNMDAIEYTPPLEHEVERIAFYLEKNRLQRNEIEQKHLTAVHKRLTSMILSKLRGNRYAK